MDHMYRYISKYLERRPRHIYQVGRGIAGEMNQTTQCLDKGKHIQNATYWFCWIDLVAELSHS